MVVRQEEESERWQQQKLNELNLLHEFTEAAFEEACYNGLDTILQPVIHLRQEIIIIIIIGWDYCYDFNRFSLYRLDQ